MGCLGVIAARAAPACQPGSAAEELTARTANIQYPIVAASSKRPVPFICCLTVSLLCNRSTGPPPVSPASIPRGCVEVKRYAENLFVAVSCNRAPTNSAFCVCGFARLAAAQGGEDLDVGEQNREDDEQDDAAQD